MIYFPSNYIQYFTYRFLLVSYFVSNNVLYINRKRKTVIKKPMACTIISFNYLGNTIMLIQQTTCY